MSLLRYIHVSENLIDICGVFRYTCRRRVGVTYSSKLIGDYGLLQSVPRCYIKGFEGVDNSWQPYVRGLKKVPSVVHGVMYEILLEGLRPTPQLCLPLYSSVSVASRLGPRRTQNCSPRLTAILISLRASGIPSCIRMR